MAVPVFTLDRARKRVDSEVRKRWSNILDKTAFIGGFEVTEFEAAFSEFTGAAGAVGVGNGTDALTVSIHALGISPGDEVIVPALSFYATAEAVVWAGGVPVFADVRSDTLNLDPAAVRCSVSERTVGVIGVHLYGRPFDVTPIRETCAEHGLWLLEDAAQAHGATYEGQPVGSLGDLAAWSFYPSKNLGCFGDGGAITGSDAGRLQEARLFANHGLVGRYEFARIGTNSRLDALQAAVLNARLPLLAGDNERRLELAGRYKEELSGFKEVAFLKDVVGSRSVYHQLTVLVEKRDELQAFLADRDIGTSIHYPEALHLIEPMRNLLASVGASRKTHPVAEASAKKILCLPMFPELADSELEEVCAGIRAFYCR